MRFTVGKGIKGVNHYPNFILKADDMLYLSTMAYQNATDLLAMILGDRRKTVDYAVNGLVLVPTTGLMANLGAGAGLSYSGEYIDDDGAWGFVAIAENIFSIIVPEDVIVSFSAGDVTHPRIDTLQVRPKLETYYADDRLVRDPITGSVSSVVADSRAHYFYEFMVLEGTPAASPVAPVKTAGWIKLAEVRVNAGASVIASVVTVAGSASWTANVNSTVLPFNQTAPATSGAGGYEGEMRADSTWLYIYKNSAWRRVGIATW